MDDLEKGSAARNDAAVVFFTCTVCGAVEEIRVPRIEGLPPKVYWECLACRVRDDGVGRTRNRSTGFK